MEDPLSFASEYPPLTWEDAAQDAAFAGRCFCTHSNGHLINSDALADGIRHDSPFAVCVIIGERPIPFRPTRGRASVAAIEYAGIGERVLRSDVGVASPCVRTIIASDDPENDANAYEAPLVGV